MRVSLIILTFFLIFSSKCNSHINSFQREPMEELNNRFVARAHLTREEIDMRNSRRKIEEFEKDLSVSLKKLTFISFTYMCGLSYLYFKDDNCNDIIYESFPLIVSTWFGIVVAELGYCFIKHKS